MKFTLGFLAGLGAAWAALAIFQRLPELGPIDAIDDRPISYEEAIALRGRGVWPPPPEVDREAFVRAADANQLRYRSQHRAGLGAIRP